MARTAARELEERKVRVLGRLRDAGAADRPIPLSLSALSAALGITECRARCSLRALKDEGMIAVRPRFLPNGGQQENAYRITAKGRNWLVLVGDEPPSGEGGREDDHGEKERGSCRLKRTA